MDLAGTAGVVLGAVTLGAESRCDSDDSTECPGVVTSTFGGLLVGVSASVLIGGIVLTAIGAVGQEVPGDGRVANPLVPELFIAPAGMTARWQF